MGSMSRLLLAVGFVAIGLSLLNYLYLRQHTPVVGMVQAYGTQPTPVPSGADWAHQMIHAIDAVEAEKPREVPDPYAQAEVVHQRNSFVNRQLAIFIMAGAGFILLWRRR